MECNVYGLEFSKFFVTYLKLEQERYAPFLLGSSPIIFFASAFFYRVDRVDREERVDRVDRGMMGGGGWVG